ALLAIDCRTLWLPVCLKPEVENVESAGRDVAAAACAGKVQSGQVPIERPPRCIFVATRFKRRAGAWRVYCEGPPPREVQRPYRDADAIVKSAVGIPERIGMPGTEVDQACASRTDIVAGLAHVEQLP